MLDGLEFFYFEVNQVSVEWSCVINFDSGFFSVLVGEFLLIEEVMFGYIEVEWINVCEEVCEVFNCCKQVCLMCRGVLDVDNDSDGIVSSDFFQLSGGMFFCFVVVVEIDDNEIGIVLYYCCWDGDIYFVVIMSIEDVEGDGDLEIEVDFELMIVCIVAEVSEVDILVLIWVCCGMQEFKNQILRDFYIGQVFLFVYFLIEYGVLILLFLGWIVFMVCFFCFVCVQCVRCRRIFWWCG